MGSGMGASSDNAFGAELRRQRQAAGLTLEELAARAGLSARGIADLERGARHTPRRETVELLARALETSNGDPAALYAAARRPTAPPNRSDVAATSARPKHNLPAQMTRLLGREGAVRAVTALVRRADVRLVTLTGPGGVGKTRLAIAAAFELLGDFPDGVWFVRLSRLTDPALVIPTIAKTLGVAETGDQPVADALCAYLRERSLLLVLDNCEHLATAAPDIAELLQASPALKALTTSRAALRIQGEHEYPALPLALPPALSALGAPGATQTPEWLMEYPAIALFVERAAAVLPDFALTTANAPAVAAICARLDGLPLAIELAAARIKLLAPSSLQAQLERGLGFLADGPRDLAERQQAMRNTIAWSENLLTAEQSVLFRRLAVFVGGCSVEAAQAVCVSPEGAAPLRLDALEGLGALVNQSLTQQREEGSAPRFGMLRVIREYALEQLEASQEADSLRRAHAASMLALAERAEPQLVGPEAGMWLERLDIEHDNLRAALTWASERGAIEMGLRLVAAVFRFWVVRGHLREGRAWAERLLALARNDSSVASSAALARALRAAGVIALYQSDEQAAGGWLEQAAALGRAADDLPTAALALNSLGVVAMHNGALDQAAAYLEESLTLLRVVGRQRDIASAHINLGVVAILSGDLERATETLSEALAAARQAGDRDLIATTLANLASVALHRRAITQAEALGREALALYRDLGDPRRCAVGLEGLAASAGLAGNGERAARLLGASSALREGLGTPAASHEREEVEMMVAEARATLGEERWAAALAAGAALTPAAAIAEALRTVAQRLDQAITS